MAFNKRIPESLSNYLYWVRQAATRLPSLARTASGTDGVDGLFREEIMLAVTSVNDCRYCAFVHSSLAELEGVELEEIHKLLDPTYVPGDPKLAAAVHYARECAQAGRLPPSRESREALKQYFSKDEIAGIEASIAGIELGNLSGNTIDAFGARLTGDRKLTEKGLLLEAVITGIGVSAGLPALALGTAAKAAARIRGKRLPA